jgi:hypothetical protein
VQHAQWPTKDILLLQRSNRTGHNYPRGRDQSHCYTGSFFNRLYTTISYCIVQISWVKSYKYTLYKQMIHQGNLGLGAGAPPPSSCRVVVFDGGVDPGAHTFRPRSCQKPTKKKKLLSFFIAEIFKRERNQKTEKYVYPRTVFCGVNHRLFYLIGAKPFIH